MNRRSFQSFMTKKLLSMVEEASPLFEPAQDYNGYYPVGGFMPVSSNVTEAAEDDTTYSKTPILFNREDVLYLWQFPPGLQKQALALRYNQLLLSSKQKQERGQDVPGTHDVLIPGRKGAIYRFKNIKHETGSLIERLEQKRDLKTLRDLDPTKADQYKGGLHQYDLGGVQKDEQTGQLIAKGFIGLTEGTAGKIFNEWRDGITPGWLGKPKNGAKIKPVNFGGGKPSKNITLDWHGNPLPPVGSNIQMPVWGNEHLRGVKFRDSDETPLLDPRSINENGEVSHSYEILRPPRGIDESAAEKWRQQLMSDFYDGKPAPDTGWTPEATAHTPLPMFRPGGLVSSKPYHDYNKLVQQLQPLYDPEAGKWRSTSEAKNIIDTALKFLPDSGAPEAAKRYSELDYVLGRFNKEGESINNTTIKIGGNQNLKNAKEQIPASQDDRNFLQKHFIYNKFDANGRWSTLDALDRSQTRSPVAEGVFSSLYRIKGTTNYYALNQHLDELKQEAGMSVLKLAGDPLYKEFIEAKKAASKTADPKEHANVAKLYEDVWRKIKQRSATFAEEIAQFDWGQGTRRKRRERGDQSADTVGDDTGRDAYGITKMGQQDDAGYTMSRPDAGADAGPIVNRAAGQRTIIRARGGKYATNAAGNMFQSGHSPAAIVAEIKRRASQRDQINASGVDSWDEKTSQNNLKQDIQASVELINDFKDQYISSKPDASEEEALAWADTKTREILKSSNVKVSVGLSSDDIPKKPPKANANPPALRKYATRWAADNKTTPEPEMPGVETLLQMDPKNLPGHVSSPVFLDYLKNNPQELQKAKVVATKLQSRALFAAIAKAEAGQTVPMPTPTKPIAPVQSANDDDDEDYSSYRSARAR